MPEYAARVFDGLETFVGEVEAETAAEIVLVLTHRAEPYLDVPWKCGSLLALVGLTAMVFVPYDFRAEWLPLDALLLFLLGALLGRGPGAVRLLTRKKRRQASVARLGRAVFSERGVGLTRERTGVLLLVARLEREVHVLADIGVDRALPAGEWQNALRRFEAAAPLEAFPSRLGKAFEPIRRLLREHLPPRSDDRDEIQNRPVVIA